MKKLVGFDLNGWNDFAARNWLEVPGQEARETEEPVIIRGGMGSVVVQVKDTAHKAEFIGGMQALRSPHGRGDGWGEIGTGSRCNVSDLLKNPEEHKDRIASALGSMASIRKTTAVLSIPDLKPLDEDRQEALLAAMQVLQPGRQLLVWRPVLAVLSALACPDGINWDNVGTVGVAGHDARGFASQKLQLQKDRVFAPERRKPGQLHESAFGLDSLLEQARNALRARCADPARADHVMASQLPWKLALGAACDPEPLRQWNGSWETITPPLEFVPETPDIPESLIRRLQGCDVILFETPATGAMRDLIASRLSQAMGRGLHTLAPEAVAMGALEAARRMERNQPVYFDFLPQISTIVQGAEGAKSYDLIPRDAVLPAGRLYRSKSPARLGIQAGMEEINIYLKKKTIAGPRRAVLALTRPAASSAPVELHVEQAPAAGRARLTLVSEAFAGPMVVDWDSAEQLDQGWEELIESLEPEHPTIPNRLVLPCATDKWFEQKNRPGLLDILQQEVPARWPNWNRLADKLSGSPYPVSGDGEYPEGLPGSARALLEQAITLAQNDIRARLRGGGASDNGSLKFLTWLFHKCPDWVVPHMLDALEAGIGNHVFFEKHQSRTLLLQGLGRTAGKPEDQRRTFSYLCSIPAGRWKKDQMACAAFMLSRTDSAPPLLKRNEVDFIAAIAEAKVREAVGQDFTTRFSYGPYLLVGLLRWRLREPWALVAGPDPVADRLLAATRSLAKYLASRMAGATYLERYHKILEQVCEELEGKGSNPNILFDLENMT